MTVTSAPKRIANGITARVVRDSVTEDRAVVEDTFDWYAQDGNGTTWYLGEATAEFAHGRVSSREGSFEAGADGALAGVAMPAEPAVSVAYRQEYYAGEAENNGEVLSVDEMAEVPAWAGAHPRISGGGGREELVARTEVSADTARQAAAAPLGEPYR